MKSNAFILAITYSLFLAACDPYPVNFAYSKPNNLGLFDPRSTAAGTMYAWNTETNRLIAVGEVALTPGTATDPRTLSGESLSGFGVEGLPIGDTKLVETKIANQFKTVVNDSVRQPYFGVKSALRSFVVARKEAGSDEDDIEDIFRARDERYRTVIVTAEESSGSVSIRAGDPEGTGSQTAKFKVQLASQEVVTVSVNSLSAAKCGGGSTDASPERATCFVEYSVYNPFYKQNGNLDWRRDDDFDQSKLSEALRNL
jgi:hypothetical protein